MSETTQVTFRTNDEFVDTSTVAAVKLSDVLSAEEIKPFVARSDLRASWMMAVNFAIIAGAFLLPAIWLNPLTIMLSILLLGGRQMGMAVIYHDCSHGVFYRNRWLNDFVGHWVAAALLNTSMYAYRTYHLKHHRFAGTNDDPDMPLALSYPASRASLKRKFSRDLTGRTGWKDVYRQFSKLRPKRNAPFLISHALLFGALWAAGAAWRGCPCWQSACSYGRPWQTPLWSAHPLNCWALKSTSLRKTRDRAPPVRPCALPLWRWRGSNA